MQQIISRMFEKIKATRLMEQEDNRRSSKMHGGKKQLGKTDSGNSVESEKRHLKHAEPYGKVSELTVLDQSLTVVEKRALRITWLRMQGRQGQGNVHLCERVFDKLTRRCPKLRQVFCKQYVVNALQHKGARSESYATIQGHARMLSEYIDYCISWLNDEVVGLAYEHKENVQLKAKLIGRCHSSLLPFGVRGNTWELLGEILAEEILTCECVRNCLKGHRAWNMLIVTMIDHLRSGFEQGVKLQHEKQRSACSTPMDEYYRSRSPSPLPFTDGVPTGSGTATAPEPEPESDFRPSFSYNPYQPFSKVSVLAQRLPQALERVKNAAGSSRMHMSMSDYSPMKNYTSSSSKQPLSTAATSASPKQRATPRKESPIPHAQVMTARPDSLESQHSGGRRGSWHFLCDAEPPVNTSVAAQEAFFDRLFDTSATNHAKRSMSVVHLKDT